MLWIYTVDKAIFTGLYFWQKIFFQQELLIFSYFQQNYKCPTEVLLLSTHNIDFCEKVEKKKNIFVMIFLFSRVIVV